MKEGETYTLTVKEGVEVSIVLDKDFKPKIVIITDEGSKSVRSIVELMNVLITKHNVDRETITGKVIPWVNNRIRELSKP